MNERSDGLWKRAAIPALLAGVAIVLRMTCISAPGLGYALVPSAQAPGFLASLPLIPTFPFLSHLGFLCSSPYLALAVGWLLGIILENAPGLRRIAIKGATGYALGLALLVLPTVLSYAWLSASFAPALPLIVLPASSLIAWTLIGLLISRIKPKKSAA